MLEGEGRSVRERVDAVENQVNEIRGSGGGNRDSGHEEQEDEVRPGKDDLDQVAFPEARRLLGRGQPPAQDLSFRAHRHD